MAEKSSGTAGLKVTLAGYYRSTGLNNNIDRSHRYGSTPIVIPITFVIRDGPLEADSYGAGRLTMSGN